MLKPNQFKKIAKIATKSNAKIAVGNLTEKSYQKFFQEVLQIVLIAKMQNNLEGFC